MFICNECKNIFRETIEIKSDLGVDYEISRGYQELYQCCPYCKSINVEEAKKCDICGEYGDLIIGENIKYCKYCRDKQLKKFKILIADNFSEDEKEILFDEGKIDYDV